MLSPLSNSTNFSPFTVLLAATLLCALNISSAYAEITRYYRQEPIFPIPLKIEIDNNKAELGEMLFFDTRLSSNNQTSCASCHQLEAGGDDNVAIGTSMVTDQHILNTPSIFNVVYNFRQNWDGSIKTLEEQVDAALKNHHEFNNNWADVITTLSEDVDLKNDFYDNYPSGITKDNIINAIVEFEKTLTTPNSRFDQYLKNFYAQYDSL